MGAMNTLEHTPGSMAGGDDGLIPPERPGDYPGEGDDSDDQRITRGIGEIESHLALRALLDELDFVLDEIEAAEAGAPAENSTEEPRRADHIFEAERVGRRFVEVTAGASAVGSQIEIIYPGVVPTVMPRDEMQDYVRKQPNTAVDDTLSLVYGRMSLV